MGFARCLGVKFYRPPTWKSFVIFLKNYENLVLVEVIWFTLLVISIGILEKR